MPLTPEEMDTNNVPVHMKHQGLSVGLNSLHRHTNVRMSFLSGELSRQWRSGIAHWLSHYARAFLMSASQQGSAARHFATWHRTENVACTIADSVQRDPSGVFRPCVCVSDDVLIACTCSCCNLLSHLPALPCHMQFANSNFCL